MWGIGLQIGLKVLGFILDRVQAKAETRRAFLAFVDSLEDSQLVSAKLSASYRAQLERLGK